MNFERTLNKLEKIIAPAVEEAVANCGLKIYDFDYQAGSSTFRIFIFDENTGSATLDNCVEVDRALSNFFEDHDNIPENIRLEVSSPGVYRSLKTLEHFKMTIGQLLKLKLFQPIESVKGKVVECQLNEVNTDSITVEILKTKNDNKVLDIKFSNIKSANVDYKF